MPSPKIILPKLGQESVWDYPRPPKLEKTDKNLEIYFNGTQLAQTKNGYRVLETSHPPVYYFPLSDILPGSLIPSDKITFCEWKGQGSYYHVQIKDKKVLNAAWFYSTPSPNFLPIKDFVAFYPQFMDSCTVNGEEVIPQPGGFYGGWITKEIIGPFKGEPGSFGW